MILNKTREFVCILVSGETLNRRARRVLAETAENTGLSLTELCDLCEAFPISAVKGFASRVAYWLWYA